VKRLIHFFSLAVVTQIILMLGQLILLPIQLRMWGASSTALWYSAFAVASVTYFVDCGLRTAGHAELLRGSTLDVLQFRQIWSWIRTLLLAGTFLLICGDFAAGKLMHAGPYQISRVMQILACALESILIVRISYLDSLGKYRGAEASYFSFAALRLMLSIPALVVFHWQATGLAAVYLFTSALAVVLQGELLCKSIPLLHLTNRFPKLAWSSLALARYTVAEPLANWTRLSLPVLVIAQIASPVAVTTYVALRAIFGAGRTTIQQLARVASVEALKARAAGESKRADSLLTLFVVAAVFFGSMLGAAVVTDNGQLIGMWLKKLDHRLFQEIALAFSLTAPFFSYQIAMSLRVRMGELAYVAHRHYIFISVSLMFAGLSVVAASLPLYLLLLVTAEVTLSVSFFVPTRAGQAALQVASGGSLTVALLWLAAHRDLQSLAGSAASLFIVIILFGSLLWWIYRPDYLAVAK